MPAANIGGWIRIGVWALPVYGLLTFWTTLDPQPDPTKHYEAWSRYVTTNHYVLTHVLGSGLGTVLAIFGVFALGAYLATGRAGRPGGPERLWHMGEEETGTRTSNTLEVATLRGLYQQAVSETPSASHRFIRDSSRIHRPRSR